MNKNLEKFEEIVKILEKDTASVSEVADLVATIIQVVKEAKEFLEKQAIDNKKDLNNFVNRLTEQEVQKIAEALDNLEKKAEKVVKSIKEKTALDLDSITRNLYQELKKLENLEGDERLDKKAIKGLEDEIKQLRKEIGTKSSGGVRRVYQPKLDRFKDNCNGSNKTFYLSREPLATDTIEVSGTDFPIILDPTVDFTVSGKTLTLASATPAPNSGATLICKYYV